MEVPRLEVELELQLLAWATATQLQAMSETYTTAPGNAGSLTHQARPGIEPTLSGTLLSHDGNSHSPVLCDSTAQMEKGRCRRVKFRPQSPAASEWKLRAYFQVGLVYPVVH